MKKLSLFPFFSCSHLLWLAQLLSLFVGGEVSKIMFSVICHEIFAYLNETCSDISNRQGMLAQKLLKNFPLFALYMVLKFEEAIEFSLQSFSRPTQLLLEKMLLVGYLAYLLYRCLQSKPRGECFTQSLLKGKVLFNIILHFYATVLPA